MEIATVAAGVVEAPVPVSAITCGEFAALLVKVSVPVRVPDAVGVNERLTVQLAPGATVALVLQVPLARPKSPVIENALGKLRDAVPALVTVTYCTELVKPTLTVPKFKDVGLMEALTGVAAAAAAAMLMLALAVFVVPAVLRAVTVTEPPVGTDDGAV
jgi:hypothetical protein